MVCIAASLPLLPDTGRLLVVGHGTGCKTSGLTGPQSIVPYIALDALDAETLRKAAPDLVLCALFAADLASGDAFALVERLETLHYRGRILVICPTLPSPRMIEAELQALGPGPLLTLIARN